MSHTIDEHSPPSEDEQENYFYIAVIDTLEQDTSGWDSVYPIRIGPMYGLFKIDDHPVVLLVTLRIGIFLSWESALIRALRCRAVHLKHGVDNVHVEMKMGEFVPMAWPASQTLAASVDWSFSGPIIPDADKNLVEWELASINASLMSLLPYPGHAIEQKEAKDGELEAVQGTLGLSLRLVDPAKMTAYATTEQEPEPPGPAFALTSRHVAVGLRLPPSMDIVPETTRDIPSISPSSAQLKIFSEAGPSTKTALRKLKDSLSFQQANSGAVVRPTPSSRPQDQEDASQRLIGTVAFSPAHQTDKHGAWVDWAVYLCEACTHQMSRWVRSFKDAQPHWRHLQVDLVDNQLAVDDFGFMSLHARDLPSEPAFHQCNRTSHVVAKRGRNTGLTYGVTNEIEAIRCLPSTPEQGPAVVLFHLLIVGVDERPFSQPGDSGSCISDTSGRVVGVLDGGYVTEHVKRYFEHHEKDKNTTMPNVSDVCHAHPIDC
ncbi:hypothetical protein SBRCBS47491_006235 [Sporothrix bragantina]|uniref:Peptidase S1 domain-containing protein n=1 Tax=Sporothrix bragantina TaxID=671064 RepID=A0ABP0C393_9PEZI